MSSQPSLEGKTDRYRRFWTRSPLERPLIGFSVGGWFPLQSYRAMQKLRGEPILRPDDLHPEEFLPDYEGIVALWDGLEDDMIRGLAPLPPFSVGSIFPTGTPGAGSTSNSSRCSASALAVGSRWASPSSEARPT
jgi:hypothetical protein